MRSSRTIALAVCLATLSLAPGCRRAPQTKLEKLEAREQALEKKIEKLREKQRQIEAKLPEIEDRLAQTREALDRERGREDAGTERPRRKRPTPTPAEPS